MTNAGIVPTYLYFTSSGCIGVIAELEDRLALQLTELQRNLAWSEKRDITTSHTRYVTRVILECLINAEDQISHSEEQSEQERCRPTFLWVPGR